MQIMSDDLLHLEMCELFQLLENNPQLGMTLAEKDWNVGFIGAPFFRAGVEESSGIRFGLFMVLRHFVRVRLVRSLIPCSLRS